MTTPSPHTSHDAGHTGHRDVHVTEYHSVVDGSTQLIDVRQPDEFATGTLPGAVNIPLDALPGRLGELDTERRVVLLCRSGARSGAAAQYLARAGFGDVVNLAGGMLDHDGARR